MADKGGTVIFRLAVPSGMSASPCLDSTMGVAFFFFDHFAVRRLRGRIRMVRPPLCSPDSLDSMPSMGSSSSASCSSTCCEIGVGATGARIASLGLVDSGRSNCEARDARAVVGGTISGRMMEAG